MKTVCFYFQIHQPYRLSEYTFFDLNSAKSYFNDDLNRSILKRVSANCYLRINDFFKKLIEKCDGKFKFSISISGTALEQFEAWQPEVITSFKELLDTGCVELMGETYYHSLASVYSPNEFKEQVSLHKDIIQRLFGVQPVTFRNTELIYDQDIAKLIGDLDYEKSICEEQKEFKSTSRVINYSKSPELKTLVRNNEFSDDIGFRFSDKNWKLYPLTSQKYSKRILESPYEIINLFMDYETFGEHQWDGGKIITFIEQFVNDSCKQSQIDFNTIQEASKTHNPDFTYKGKSKSSWADLEKDWTAWMGNSLQNEAFEKLYKLEEKVLKSGNQEALDTWRKLQTSDHCYYMCLKVGSDGYVHNYFNPYGSPHAAYVYFMNVLKDFERKL